MNDTTHRMYTIVLSIALLLSLVAVGYLAITEEARTNEPYTAFYILGPDGSASEYPLNVSVNESAPLTVGIENNEQAGLTYTVVLTVDDEPHTTHTIDVPRDQTVEERITFTPDEPGELDLQLVLYLGEDPDVTTEPYRRLYLTVTVS